MSRPKRRYTIKVPLTGFYTVTVEADTEAEARGMALRAAPDFDISNDETDNDVDDFEMRPDHRPVDVLDWRDL